MKALDSDYTGCPIHIYDESGNHLCNTMVTYYNKKILRIEVEDPPDLEAGDECKLLILTAPKPCEYRGRIIRIGKRKPIVIYRGQELEKREESRFRVKMPASIEDFICNGNPYPLMLPLRVELINISKRGARFRAPFNTLSDGDRFLLRMRIGDKEKVLLTEIKNHLDNENGISEYGCRFIVGND